MKFWSLDLIKQRELAKQLNKEAIAEYGFSCNGELKEIKNIEVKPLTAGIYNLVKQLLP